jgi:hypothetical protein
MNHTRLTLVIAVIGFVFTSRPWLQWLNTLSPEGGLLVKNVVAFLCIYAIHFTDGLVARPHIQALGTLMLYTAFMMIFNYQSEWIADIHAHNVEKQTPDGAMYHRARNFGLMPDAARIVTFVVVPTLLIFIGSRIRDQRVRIF